MGRTAVMTETRVNRFLVTPVVWATALGASAFVAGFVGPMFLSRGANLGPVLGFFAGPVGFAGGLVLGLIASLFRPSRQASAWSIGVAAILLVTRVLYMSLPEPRYVGTVIDAEIVSCSDPAILMPAANENWELAVESKPDWREVRQDWKQEAEQLLADNDGVVLELELQSEWKLYEQRHPWNRGSVIAERVLGGTERRSFFARYAGSSCDRYKPGTRSLYSVHRDSAPVWPPGTLPHYLWLHVVEEYEGPVPGPK